MIRSLFLYVSMTLVAGLVVALPREHLSQSDEENAKKNSKPASSDWEDSIAKSINAQNPVLQIGTRTNYTGPSYTQFPYRIRHPVGYRALLISPDEDGTNHLLTFPISSLWEGTVIQRRWKGVIVGRDPEPVGRGAVEPIDLPRFEYDLKPEVKDEPRRVAMRFWLAKDVKNEMPSWEFEVTAAVVTPMTAVALDGRLGLFTLTAADEEGRRIGAAIHPALEGHRLAYRPALLDLFAEIDEIAFLKVLPADARDALLGLALANPDLTAADKAKIRARLKQPLRLADDTVKNLVEQRKRNNKGTSSTLSAVVEKPWQLEEGALKAANIGTDASKVVFKFAHRIVYEDGMGDYKEIPVSDQVSKDVFASLTASEWQLVRDYNEAVVVHRIIYWVKQGKIARFDRDQNWSKMIDDLGDIYKANLDKVIDATELAQATANWSDEYNGKDREIPEKMRFQNPLNTTKTIPPPSSTGSYWPLALLPFVVALVFYLLWFMYRCFNAPRCWLQQFRSGRSRCALCRGAGRRWIPLANQSGLVFLPCECAQSLVSGATSKSGNS